MRFSTSRDSFEPTLTENNSKFAYFSTSFPQPRMSQAATAAPKAVSMPMRLKMPAEFPNIGKFSDSVEWASLAAPKMYFKDEELKEEEVGEVVKDAEYYKKKRNQRRSYRKKNMLLFEDADYAPIPGGLKFNGQMVNTTLADMEAKELNKHSAFDNGEEVPFKYVLLQFTKKEGGENEIQVIPVGDMYLFKKAPKQADELLADIEAKFENERMRMKDRHEKYKGIYHSLAMAEKKRAALDGEEEEFTGGFESTSLFSKGLKSLRRKSSGVSLSREGGGSGEGGGGGGGGRGVQQYINENGIDMDDLREHDWCQGDYTSRFADDEEDNVVHEQLSNNRDEDNDFSASLRYDESDLPDSDAEDEEGDKKGEEDEDEEQGMVDESMVSSAAEARKMLNLSNLNKKVQQDKQAAQVASNTAANAAVGGASAQAPEASAAVGAKASLKRGREERDGGAAPGQRVSFEESSSDAKKTKAGAGGSGAPAAAAAVASITSGGSEYSFNEEGVRKFILHKGGKVLTGVLLEFFKPMIKAYRDESGKKSGKERFLGIVKDATVTMEDPVMGTVLTVKQS